MNLKAILSRWYSPNNDRYSRDQVIWLLWALEDLKEGWYPVRSIDGCSRATKKLGKPSTCLECPYAVCVIESGYQLSIKSKSFLPCARFEKACNVIGEIEARLIHTQKEDRDLLLAELTTKRWAYFQAMLVGNGIIYERQRRDALAEVNKDFSPAAYMALMYCTGQQRRFTPYRFFKAKQQKKVTNVTKTEYFTVST